MLFGSQGGDKQHRVAITSNLEFSLNCWDNIAQMIYRWCVTEQQMNKDDEGTRIRYEVGCEREVRTNSVKYFRKFLASRSRNFVVNSKAVS